jgi:S1-C subfamily serine protease
MTEPERNRGVSGAVALLIAAGALMVGLLSGAVLGVAGGFLLGQSMADDASEAAEPSGVALHIERLFEDESDAEETGDVEPGVRGYRDRLPHRPELRGPFERELPKGFEDLDELPFMPGPGVMGLGEESPFLGVIVSTVGEGEEPPPTDAESGAYIEQIEPGTAADDAGLKPGDVVVSFDGVLIETMEDLAEAVSESEVDGEVTLIVQRDGKDVVVTATIGSRRMAIPIEPGNLDEMLERMPPEMREHFRDMLEQRPEQPEA